MYPTSTFLWFFAVVLFRGINKLRSINPPEGFDSNPGSSDFPESGDRLFAFECGGLIRIAQYHLHYSQPWLLGALVLAVRRVEDPKRLDSLLGMGQAAIAADLANSIGGL